MRSKAKGESLFTIHVSVQELLVAQMSNSETQPNKRKELEDCDEENPKKSKTESADTLIDSSGHETNDTKENHLGDETLPGAGSEEATELDKAQVEWI